MEKEIDVTFTARIMLSIINEVGSLGLSVLLLVIMVEI